LPKEARLHGATLDLSDAILELEKFVARRRAKV
jgi:hypothetical protein